MKNILVTGADGFIGSHLVEHLLKKNFNVKALSLYNSFNTHGWLENLNLDAKDIEVVSGDIRDSDFCNQIIKNVDTVFHLASLIAIPYSYIAPQSYVDTNIKGTLNICQASIKNNISHLIHTSTSEVYGTAQYVPIDEKHPLNAQSPYSASKIAADAIATSFYNSFEMPVTIARPFNTYGPRQSARAVIPSIIIQIASGLKNIQLGDLSPTRDFNYVDDTCRGIISLTENRKKTLGKIINIGSNSEISIRETIDLISNLMGKKINIKKDKKRLRPKKSEVMRLCCDNSLIKKLTGYKPRIDLKKGLKKTIDWFTNSNNLELYKENIYNI